MVKNYEIEGDFSPLARGRTNGGKQFDTWSHAVLLFGNGIESQHMGERLFKGHLSVDMVFYLAFEMGVGEKRRQLLNNKHVSSRPRMSALLKALEEICVGVLFEDGSIIVSVRAEKRRSTNPRLEMIITEIDDAKGTGSKEKTQ